MKFTQLAGSLVAATVIGTAAQADKLDDIISSGTLRCAVVLDFPPMGSRDDSNTPVGFDGLHVVEVGLLVGGVPVKPPSD